MSEGDDSDALARQLAQVLGATVIIGSLGVKLPVIRNVLRFRTAAGLSPAAIYLELVALACSIAFHALRDVPLAAWAECLSVMAQDLCLVALMWAFDGPGVTHMLVVLAGFGATCAILSDFEPDLLWVLPLAATAIGACGHVPQIASNWRNGHTGALSLITQTLNVLGAGARVFTTIQLVNDSVAVASICVSFTLHCILFLQILAMRDATARAMADRTSKAKAA